MLCLINRYNQIYQLYPSPFNFTQIHQLNTTSSSSDLNSLTSSSPINTEELTKRREDFIKEATSLYNNKYRILSNSVYDFYVNRLKITQNLDPRILLKKDLEIKSKFQLAVFNEGGKTIERLVENGKLHRKLISIEKVFDVIHEYHNRFGHGKKLAISNALKQEYANITLNCVLLYMTNCKECFMASKNSKTLNKDTTMEGSSSDFQNEMKPIIEDNDVIELEEKIVTNNYFDYNKHFTISKNDIRCKHCEFIYLLTNLNKNQEKILKSHLINYHKQFYNEIISKGDINEEDDKVDEEEEEEEEEENDDFN
ncbi:hypothetical protein Mgra_00003494 [Meloidogyne graminicola]|uniref:Uncharacterized protein n=1 Tax=Meloidogyne graminicola TaxID=189291 RepID=A0A8S9ZUZ3_9BILA|nr:hypothetical protein Mgra_00003494 [Meloidogyne graminicola]KAF7637106.1 hypothetical protein Mgra_00003494 [Meloidogyne graminicola]